MSQPNNSIPSRFSARDRRQGGFSALSPLAFLAFVSCILAVLMLFLGQKANAQADHRPEQTTTTPAESSSVRLDAQLVDAVRQLELFTTLAQIGAAFQQLQPYRESILVLLDPRLPVEERWRRALEIQPAHMPTQSSVDSEELNWIRMEIDAIRAEISALQNLPNIIHTPPPVDPDPVVVQEGEGYDEPSWDIDSGSLRYVQLAESGLEPAIWLASESSGVRVVQKETIRHQGRLIHLSDLRREESGRIQVHLIVDGEPYVLTY